MKTKAEELVELRKWVGCEIKHKPQFSALTEEEIDAAQDMILKNMTDSMILDALPTATGISDEMMVDVVKMQVSFVLKQLDLGDVLVRVEDGDGYKYCLMRDKGQIFSMEFVDEHLRKPKLVERVNSTFRAGFTFMYTLNEAGRAAAGSIYLFGTKEMCRRLKVSHETIDDRVEKGKLEPIAKAGRTRVFCQWNVDQQKKRVDEGPKPDVVIFKKTAVAKVAGISISTMNHHIQQRIMYGHVIGEQWGSGTMVFTKEQVIAYIEFLQNKKVGQVVKWEN